MAEPLRSRGLRADALGLASSVMIGVSSAAPAYSLAAVLGVLAGAVGLHAPAALLLAFIPMVCTAAAYNAFDRVAPDAGSVFAWLWRTIGPRSGWIAGWALIVANVIVMGSLGEIAGRYTFLLVGWSSAAQSVAGVTIAGTAWITVVTALCYVGIHVSARTQRGLLSLELFALLIFSVVALVRVLTGHAGAHAVAPQAGWFSPVGIGGHGSLADGVLAALFIFWGWDTTASVAEETRDPGPTAGRAALLSTVFLLVVFLLVVTAAQAFDGPGALSAHPVDALSALAGAVLGNPLGKLVVLAVLTSAIASAQTSVLPAARTVMAMAHVGATPRALGLIHAHHQTPHVATVAVGSAGAALFVALSVANKAVLSDTIATLGLVVAFYYGLTAFACPIYFRRQLLRSPRSLLILGVVPLIGAGGLAWVFVRTAIDLGDPANSATGAALLGIGLPLLLAGGLLLLGVVLLGLTAWRSPSFPRPALTRGSDSPGDPPPGGAASMVPPAVACPDYSPAQSAPAQLSTASTTLDSGGRRRSSTGRDIRN